MSRRFKFEEFVSRRPIGIEGSSTISKELKFKLHTIYGDDDAGVAQLVEQLTCNQ